MTDQTKSNLLTLIQYISLAYLLLFNTWFSSNPYLVTIQITGISIAIWAIVVMNKSKISISPTPRQGAILIQSGPYQWIRHPMYLSLLLAIPPMLIQNFTTLNTLIFVIFLTNLILKMLFEETLLIKFFTTYSNYMQNSWRIVPYIY